MVFHCHTASLRMTEKPIQRPTHKRLAMILDELKRSGFAFTTVSELIRSPR
jgi:hypothetical protein